MRKVLAVLALAPVCVFAQQAVRYDPSPAVTTSTNVPPGANSPVLTLPGAAITLCFDLACTTTATSYTDASASTPCPSSQPVTVGTSPICAANADNNGNFGFWLKPGLYAYKITVNGTSSGPFPITVSSNSSEEFDFLGGINDAFAIKVRAHPGLSANVTFPIPNAITTTLFVSQFVGADCGAQINAAYAALPSGGGQIIVDATCSFSTPIVFGTPNKVAILSCYGNSIGLTYTAPTGTAVTYNNGNTFDFASTFDGCALTGPGNSTGTIGLLIGGTNGAVGFSASRFKVQSFGVNVEFNSETWITKLDHGMIRDGGINLLYPNTLTASGENVQFDHITFADAPAPHTNSVWLQGNGQDVEFESCSFDQAQLRLGDGTGSAVGATINHGHFENPNYALPGSVDYPFLVVDHHNGNVVNITNTFFEQDRPSGAAYSDFLILQGGTVNMTNIGMFSPVLVPAFALLSNNVHIQLFGFGDLSGNAAVLFGGSTTGFVNSIPGTDPGVTTGFNTVIASVGDAVGGAGIQLGQDVAVGTGGQNHNLTVNGTAQFNHDVNLSGANLKFGGGTVIDTGANATLNNLAVNGIGTFSESLTFPLSPLEINAANNNDSIRFRNGATDYGFIVAGPTVAFDVLTGSRSTAWATYQSGLTSFGGSTTPQDTIDVKTGGIAMNGATFVDSSRRLFVTGIAIGTTGSNSPGVTGSTCTAWTNGICTHL